MTLITHFADGIYYSSDNSTAMQKHSQINKYFTSFKHIASRKRT